MKIEIDLLNDPKTYLHQMMVVDSYIKDNIVKLEEMEFLGLTVAINPTIKETPKNCGVKIQVKDSYKFYHVSCKKTRGGIYKFKVWRAI